MRIAFTWDGVSGRMGWGDGLWAALQIIARNHEVGYYEPLDYDGIRDYRPDVILSWSALTEESLNEVRLHDVPKALCFAGGPVESRLAYGFDLYFVESKWNLDEFRNLNLPVRTAFGVNTDRFREIPSEKLYHGMIAATFAAWKRQPLFAEALGSMGLAVGRRQDHEAWCWDDCKRFGTKLLEEVPRERIPELINQSWTVVNTASFWGGGQRLTLEAMACNVPPIVMKDSPKNSEYVLDAAYGRVVEPNAGEIREAVEELRGNRWTRGRDYVLSKWTHHHYAEALENGLREIV